MTEFTVGRLHGLTVGSTEPLPAAVPADGDERWDVSLVGASTREVPDDVPDGHLVASADANGRRQYSICEDADGTAVRAHTAAEFRLQDKEGCTTITAWRSAAFVDEIIAILFSGTVVAFVLSRRGHLVLHGSAVDLDGRRIGFIGTSGMGKSTMAALLCAAGGELVSDDVLPLSVGADGVVTAAGSVRELRLREKATSILDLFTHTPPARMTADQRLAVELPPAAEGDIQIDALIVPRPMPGLDAPAGRRLDGPAALVRLLSFPRILRWHDDDDMRMQFGLAADVAERVPVFEVDVPWGPPFHLDTARRVIDVLDL